MFSADQGVTPSGATYIEDVFSTYLYTGNNSSQTITNGIDLAGKGGLVWIKARSAAYLHCLYDTSRGIGNTISSASTAAQLSVSSPGTEELTAFNSSGFSLGTNYNYLPNTSAATYVSWTFRKQPKFFDVVTYTGDGTSGRTVAHNLGSVPGMIIVKETNATDSWYVYHRSLGATKALFLEVTNAADTSANYWSNTEPTSTQFTVGAGGGVNENTKSYVAYLFAHDAGGFGLTGTENVISCGSFNSGSAGATTSVSLGWEPQFVIIKNVSGADPWFLFDTMRGLPVAGNSAYLQANSSGAETSSSALVGPTATGFNFFSSGSSDYIYIAIRRGPMKVPTDGTKVYTNAIQTTGTTPTTSTTGFPVDLIIQSQSPAATNKFWSDRLRGSNTNFYNYVISNATSAEATGTGGGIGFDNNTGFANNLLGSNPLYNWCFRRAPGFFDVVCYTGNGSDTQTFAHNLGVVPELVILKRRSSGTGQDMAWPVAVKGSGSDAYFFVPGAGGALNLNGAAGLTTGWANYFGPGKSINASTVQPYYVTWSGPGGYESGQTYVAYLFASCPGVSKVGSYTGTGTTQQINCGFTAGARFVLIKRTDSTGDWYVWDSARGIVAGNDPYLLLNSTAAEVTSTDYIDTYSAGFEISSTAPAAINASKVRLPIREGSTRWQNSARSRNGPPASRCRSISRHACSPTPLIAPSP